MSEVTERDRQAARAWLGPADPIALDALARRLAAHVADALEARLRAVEQERDEALERADIAEAKWCGIEARLREVEASNRKSLKPKPTRRRPTDSERLDALLKWVMRGYDLHELHMFPTRATLDRMSRQLREEARRGKK